MGDGMVNQGLWSVGKYLLLEKIAAGGMAEIYLARSQGSGGIGKFFAVKSILPQFADHPDFVELFKSEAKIAVQLSQGNIVGIHEFGFYRIPASDTSPD